MHKKAHKQYYPSPSVTLAALDVGAEKTACVIADIKFAQDGMADIYISGLAHFATKGMRDGVIEDATAFYDTIGKTIIAAEKMAGKKNAIKSVYAGFSPQSISRKIIRQNLPMKKAEKMRIDYKNVEQLTHHAIASLAGADQYIMHAIPVKYMLDDHRDTDNPIGEYVHKLTLFMHGILVPQREAGAMLKAIETGGQLRCDRLVLSSFASALAVSTVAERQETILVIDMGAATTAISLFYKDALVYTRIIREGGMHITAKIAEKLGVSYADAEKIKKRDDIADKDVLNYLIREQLTLLFNDILHGLEQDPCRPLAMKASIILTGGGAQITSVFSVAETIFLRPVELRDARHVIKSRSDMTSEDINTLISPSFSSAIGVLVYYAEQWRTQMKEQSFIRSLWRGLFRRLTF